MGRPRLTTTHCKYGHKYTKENTYIHPSGGYRRSCKQCKNDCNVKSYSKRSKDPIFKEKRKAYARRAYKKITPEKRRKYVNALRLKHKKEVLIHYGKGGELRCCWRNCNVHDLDMLSLDHINNDGSEHRRKLGKGKSMGGKEMYQWIKAQNFPTGFQTLCMNHQWKKKLKKDRADKLDKQ